MTGVRFCLICLLFFSFTLPAAAEDQGPKQVVFIRYRIAPSYFATVLEGFKEVMRQRGYREGKDITYIDVLTSTADKSSVPEVREAVRKYRDSADMFITCGWVSMYAREMLAGSDVPQLFVPVLHSVALKMLPSVTREPGTNLSGLYLMYPPEKILRLAHLILPGMTRYGYVYDSTIPADMVFKSAYEALAMNQRHQVEIRFFDLAEGADKVVAAMKDQKVGAYGGIVGAFKQRRALMDSNLPVVTAFTMDVEPDQISKYVEKSNIVAGLFNPFSYCGRQAAEMTADIFDGKRTIFQTVPRPSRQIAFINLKAARRLGLTIPFAALEAVDLVVR